MLTVITAERPDTVEAMALIAELDAYLIPLYPPESHHGFSVDKLLQEAVAFFVMRRERVLAGCGASNCSVLSTGSEAHVCVSISGVRFGTLMLNHLAEHARQQGWKCCGWKQDLPIGSHQLI
jgi:hypothetical protein